LIRSFKANEVTIFVGAGISCQAGLPSWSDTIKKAKEILLNKARVNRQIGQEKDFIRRANFLQIIDRLRDITTKEEYAKFLFDQFNAVTKPSLAHSLIARLPAKFIVTTNFDTLIESAINKVYGYIPLTCTDYQKVSHALMQSRRYVIKLHGCINDLNTVVFSESDYRNFSDKQKPLLDFLRMQLDIGVVLFIGYSITDPDINSIINDSLVFTKGSKRDDFAIFCGLNPIDKQLWKKKGIVVININNFGEIELLLSRILDLVDGSGVNNGMVYAEHPHLKDQLISRSKSRYQSCDIFGLSKHCVIKDHFAQRILKGNKCTVVVPTEIRLLTNYSKKIMILGEPGSGKSYLINYLAYYLTHHEDLFDVTVNIPLGETNDESTAYDFFDKMIKYLSVDLNLPYLNIDYFKSILKSYKVAILLDGLDEVLFANRKHILRTITDLQREFPRLSIILTTRKVDVLAWNEFEMFTLENLSYEDSIELIDSWFSEYSEKVPTENIVKAKEIVKMNPCFAENALLTAAVCRVAVENKYMKLTRTRVFTQIIKWMFENYRNGSELISKDLFLALGRISLDMWNENQLNRITRSNLSKKISDYFVDGDKFSSIDEIIRILTEEIGILRNTADNNLSFFFKSIFEYFVSVGLSNTSEVETVIDNNVNNASWENVFRFLIGLADMSLQDKYVKKILDKNIPLILKCSTECINIKYIMPHLVAIDFEDDLIVLIKSLPFRLSPIELVETLESLFIRQYRNPNVLYFAVQILEEIVERSIDELARGMAKKILDNFWVESERYGIVPEMITIPEGDYWIGDDHGVDIDESPNHKIHLFSYRISTTLVTREEYAEFCPGTLINGQPKEIPITNITWYEAMLYSRWRLGIKGRLPTEAEWEVAARGCLNDTRKFPWGDEPDISMANINRSVGHITAVRSYPPNGIGIFDMCGNVFEWCLDWYDGEYYKISPIDNPKGVKCGRFKSMRGGCWARDDEAARCSYRVRQIPQTRDVLVGFRIVQSS
jgi:formylglycine-generating enzyme required for sulfatase activity/GTPase SAR1 family protein